MKKICIKFAAIIISIIIAAILIVKFWNHFEDRSKVLLLSDSTIQCNLDSKKNLLGKLMLQNKFSVDNMKYYQITTSIAGDYAYMFTEENYNKLFGNNDAFHTDKYTLDISSIIAYAPLIYKDKELYCKAQDLEGKMYVIGSIKFVEGKVYGYIKKERLSGFGESEFTDEEIEQYKEDLKNMAEDYLKLNNNEETKYYWDACFHISDECRAIYQPDELLKKVVSRPKENQVD